ncbi:MAG: 1-acyl-sn-glycerol-3-phosphate acyltransferase [Clostridia bacterium]|nr:1-acyl-sn-glycerol-3-phosphate acyltransferase [Clostridia bacterium]
MSEVRMDEGRLAVIDNIARAVADGDLFRKVEMGDPRVSPDEARRTLMRFDLERRSIFSRAKCAVALGIADGETKKINANTEIVGIDNALSVTGGAVITSNHYNVVDNTVIRHMLTKCRREKRLSIVIQESNVFMNGYFGFLMRNCKTLPVSGSAEYMSKRLKPALGRLLLGGEQILLYPEAEMWFNYRKPRGSMEGAYYYAAEFGVPVIPTFTEMRECEGIDAQGFKCVRHILHVMPPIYPRSELAKRARYLDMKERDDTAKRECYERVYGIKADEKFIPERDIAGYRAQ